MTELVEKVARAMTISEGFDPDQILEGEPTWCLSIKEATAAIEAMRPEIEREAIVAEFAEWAKTRTKDVSEQMNGIFWSEPAGGLNNPEYRRLLGQHQAYSAMRSYCHGAGQHRSKP